MRCSLIILSFLFLMLSENGECQFRSRHKPPGVFPPELVEIHFFQKKNQIIGDSGEIVIGSADFSVSYLFRIPASRLVFLAQDSIYAAQFRYSIEVFDSAGSLVFRDALEKSAFVETFIPAFSKDISYEGVFSFSLPQGSYRIESSLSDLSTGVDARLPSRNLSLSPSSLPFALPIYVSDPVRVSYESPIFEVANTFGAVPFSSRSFGLLLPVFYPSAEKVTLTFFGNSDSISFVSKTFFPGTYSIAMLNEKPFAAIDSDFDAALFYFPSINHSLHEGEYTVAVDIEGYSSHKETFSARVAWINKPLSLFDPERAAKFISYIDSASAVDKILDAPDEQLPYALSAYWKKFDPTPSTSFNELMDEFYKRIDFANFEFQTIAANDGASTSRGKVFVRFGKPDRIERTADKRGKVAEIWNYNAVKRSFIFIDEAGKGDFLLKDSL